MQPDRSRLDDKLLCQQMMAGCKKSHSEKFMTKMGVVDILDIRQVFIYYC